MQMYGFILQHSLDLFVGGLVDYMDAFFYTKPGERIPENISVSWRSGDDSIVTVANTDAQNPNCGVLTAIGVSDAANGCSTATIFASVNVDGVKFEVSTQVRVIQPDGASIIWIDNADQLDTVAVPNANKVRILGIGNGVLTNAQVQTIRSFPLLHELYIIGNASVPNNENADNTAQWFRGIGFHPQNAMAHNPAFGDLRRLVIYNTTHFGDEFFRDSTALEYVYLRHAKFIGTRVFAMPQHSSASRLHTVRLPQLEHITYRTWYYNTVLSTLELGPQALHIERPVTGGGLWFSFASLTDVMKERWPDKPHHLTIVVPDYNAFREFTRMEPDEINPGPFLQGQLNEEITWAVMPFKALSGEVLPEVETHPPYEDKDYDWLRDYYRVDFPFDNREIPISLNFFTFSKYLSAKNTNWKPLRAYARYIPALGGDTSLFEVPHEPTILDIILWSHIAGYDGVDVTGYYFEGYQSMREQTPDEKNFILEQAREVKQLAEYLGIKVVGTGFGNSFTDTNPERVATDIERCKFFMHVADTMGAPVVRVFAGNIPADEIKLGWNEIARNRLIPAIVELSQYIKQNGLDVQIGLQNHGDFISTANQALYVMHCLSALGVNNVGLVQDTGFWRAYQSLQSNFYDWYHAIKATLPISINFQFKKKPAGAGTLAGWLDLERVFKDIRISGYQGTVPIELLWGGGGIDADMHVFAGADCKTMGFGNATVNHVVNEAAWFMKVSRDASRRSLDSNMDIAAIAGSAVDITPTSRTVKSEVTGDVKPVYGAGTVSDPKVRRVAVASNVIYCRDIVPAHVGAVVTLYDGESFSNPVEQVALQNGANDLFVSVRSAKRDMYDFPRDAGGCPIWEQMPVDGLDSGVATARVPVAEQTFYRVIVELRNEV